MPGANPKMLKVQGMLTDLKRAALMKARAGGSRAFRKRMRRMAGLSSDQFQSTQEVLLRASYSDAVKNVPYYRDSIQYPTELSEYNCLDDFAKLPILEKHVVKQAPKQFLRSPRSRFLLKHTTGGTTGSPLEIYQSPLTRMATTAVVNASYDEFCNLRNPRMLNLTGFLSGDELWRRIPLTNTAYLSIYRLKPGARDEIAALLEDFRPQLIYGYASALVQLAVLFPDALPYRLRDNQLRCISTSETLLPSDRGVIESNLEAIVHNQYGSQEGQHFVFECDRRGMHVHPARGFVEILDFDIDRPVAPGEPGRVVVTGFQNRDMPLIRYSIGDTATRAADDTPCDCGCLWPMIRDVQGRTEDLVRTPDGRRIGLISHSTLKDVSGVRGSQVIQTGYDSFTYRMIVTDLYRRDDTEAHVRRELTERLGYPLTVNFDYLESIPKTLAGKHQAVVVNFE